MIRINMRDSTVVYLTARHPKVYVMGLLAISLLASWSLGESYAATLYAAQQELQRVAQQPANESYRVRKVEIKGAGNLASHRIVRACGIRPSTLLKPQELGICKEHMLQAYLRAGFIKASIEIQPQYLAADANARVGVVDILITVSEGAKYYIGAIEFQGNYKTRHRIAQRATGLTLGMPYDPSSIKKWVGGLNRLALFETVKPGDVEIEFDEQDHAAYLRFHLRER